MLNIIPVEKKGNLYCYFRQEVTKMVEFTGKVTRERVDMRSFCMKCKSE